MGTFLEQRGVTRLCHFTAIDNLDSIATHGIVPRSALAEIGADAVARDPHRLDGRLGHTSCSIEVPNIYVMNQLYPEGRCVVLMLAPGLACRPGTMCSRRNAAANFGSGVQSATNENLAHLYGESVGGWTRRVSHIPRCPTNLQAEILIEGSIPLSAVLGVIADVVALEDPRDRESVARFLNRAALPLFTCRSMFDEARLREAVRGGREGDLVLLNAKVG